LEQLPGFQPSGEKFNSYDEKEEVSSDVHGYNVQKITTAGRRNEEEPR
jgi:hypothetical protein